MAPHMVSRCAPASEPPTMARGSCQTSARSTQSSSDSPMGGRSPVRSPSATTTSRRASKGIQATLPRHVPHAPAFGAGVLRGERLVNDEAVPHGKMPQNPGLVGLRAGVEATAGRGVREGGHALGRREREDLTPTREAVEDGAVLEAQPHLHGVGQRERQHGRPAGCGGSSRRPVGPRPRRGSWPRRRARSS